MEADTCLIFFEVPTENALLAIIDALYSAAFARKAATSFLAIRNSSKRFSTLVVTSSALTYKKKSQRDVLSMDSVQKLGNKKKKTMTTDSLVQ
jgi:hypothetical protein